MAPQTDCPRPHRSYLALFLASHFLALASSASGIINRRG